MRNSGSWIQSTQSIRSFLCLLVNYLYPFQCACASSDSRLRQLVEDVASSQCRCAAFFTTITPTEFASPYTCFQEYTLRTLSETVHWTAPRRIPSVLFGFISCWQWERRGFQIYKDPFCRSRNKNHGWPARPQMDFASYSNAVDIKYCMYVWRQNLESGATKIAF